MNKPEVYSSFKSYIEKNTKDFIINMKFRIPECCQKDTLSFSLISYKRHFHIYGKLCIEIRIQEVLYVVTESVLTPLC